MRAGSHNEKIDVNQNLTRLCFNVQNKDHVKIKDIVNRVIKHTTDSMRAVEGKTAVPPGT